MSQRLRADLLLLLVALIWGTAFVTQRVAAAHVGFFTLNAMRFLLGAAVLLPFGLWRKSGRLSVPGAWWQQPVLWAGGVVFAASALQQAGLEHTTAGKAAFFTTLYVVLVPLLLWLVWRQRISPWTWAAVLAALLGAGLLSFGGVTGISEAGISDAGISDAGIGDALEIIGALFWALHLIIVGRAMTTYKLDALRFSIGQYLVAGCLNLAAGLLFERTTLSSVVSVGWAIVYLGVISTALGYTLQVVGQRHAPPADAAILLSLEAVFAALAGYFLLSEILSVWQVLGCTMIFIGVLLAQKNEQQPAPAVG